MSAPRLHALYGLQVLSDLPLGALPEAGGRPDVIIRYGEASAYARRRPAPGCFEVRPGYVLFATDAGTQIAVVRGREIIVQEGAEADLAATVSMVLGQGLAALLYQRGVLTMHASAVSMGDGAVGFVGDQGAGKTTAAAALCQTGGQLVTDDVLAVTDGETGTPHAHNGYAFLKLTQATAEHFGDSTERLEVARSAVTKWKRPQPVALGPLPLRALYVLRWGPTVAVRPLSPMEAFAEAARNLFAGQLATALGEEQALVTRCASLVQTVPVFEVVRPFDVRGIPAAANAVRAHYQTVLAATSPASSAEMPVPPLAA